MDLKDKTVVITGASRGIGAATARHFSTLGAKVYLAARSADAIAHLAREIQDAGGIAVAVECDVSQSHEVKALIDRAVSETGRVDVLVNNAALIEPIARIADSDDAAWAHVINVNVNGVYYGIRHAIPAMIAQGAGTIINISSGAATGNLEGWSHYCASKAAVLSLTRNTDLEYRDQGVRVIGLSPGTVATDMQKQIKSSGINPVSEMSWDQHIPAEWVAKGIEWLCHAEADAFLGTDFLLKTAENRQRLGLPLPA